MRRAKGKRKRNMPTPHSRRASVAVAALSGAVLKGEPLDAVTTPIAETQTPAQLLSRFGPWCLAIFAPPALILGFQTNPMFSAPTVDPWVYLGFFRNLVNFKRDLYPSTYYGSRLSWIIPGFLVHHIFSTVVAAFVLHLLVFFTASISLYYTLSVTIERRPALLCALAFGLYPFLWSAVGTDYVDGVGIAYYLLTTAFLTKAAFVKKPAYFLAAAGVVYALLFYSNITWAVFAPILGLHYLWLKREPGLRRLCAAFVWACVWSAAGFAAATVVLGTINYGLDGNFWFYRPSIQYALNNVALRSPWYQGIIVFGHLVPWLWLPFLAVTVGCLYYGASVVTGTFRASDAGALYILELGIGLGVFGYMQSRGAAPLGTYFYASYLIPLTFLGVTALTWSAARLLDTKRFVTIQLIALCVMVIPWWVSDSQFLRRAGSEPLVAGILAGGLLWGAVVSRRQHGSLYSAVACFGLLYISIAPGAPDSRAGSQLRYERVMSEREEIEAVRENRRIRWWYNDKDPNASDFKGLSSTYLWGYTLVSLNFPEIPAQATFSTPTLLGIASSRPDLREAAMHNLEGILKPRHLVAIWKRVDRVPATPVPYYIGLAMIDKEQGLNR
jgi:hypothetical protein